MILDCVKLTMSTKLPTYPLAIQMEISGDITPLQLHNYCCLSLLVLLKWWDYVTTI